MQLEWAISFARERFALGPEVERIEALKFFEGIPAGADVELELSYDPATGRLQFSYTSGERVCSFGRMQLRVAPWIRPCVVVPVYDHGAGAVPLLERLAPLGLPLVLVNDGSAPDCTALLRALAARHAGARLQRSWAAPATGLSISTYVPFALQRPPQRPGSAHVLRAMGVTISTLSCDLTRSRPGRTIAGRALLQSTR